MVKNLLFYIVFLVLFNTALGQERLLIFSTDSLQLDYRSGGVELDSVDASNIGNVNLRPAAGFAQLYEFNLAQNLAHSPSGLVYLPNEKRAKVKRTALPYLGFQYAFGSGLNQAVNVDFHQYYSEQTHLHFRYHRRTSNGLLRRGAFTLNDVHLLLHHKKERWRTALDAYYGGYDYEENGGIVSDSLIRDFPIEFTPINNQTGNSEVRKIDVLWQNYYDMYSDSLISHGFKSRTNYQLNGREYTETGLNSSSYENFFIDTSITRDNYQTTSISNGAGYFFASDFFTVDATLNHRYWRYQNLGYRRDTTELFLHSLLRVGWDRLNLHNTFYFNTLGALGEFYNRTKLHFEPLKDLVITGGVNFENRLPIPYQRFHFANNVQWELDELQTQQIVNLNGRLTYGQKHKVYAGLNFTTVTNGLFFIDDTWRQDSLGAVSVGDLTLGAEFHLEKWHFYPKATVRFNTENFNYQPAFSGRTRIVFKSGLFEAKKLILALGADLGIDLGYNHMIYNTLLSVMEPGSPDMVTPNLIRMNFFVATQIDQFRFFVRAENLDYFVNEQESRIDPNFPITPFIIRLGITWDFFN